MHVSFLNFFFFLGLNYYEIVLPLKQFKYHLNFCAVSLI